MSLHWVLFDWPWIVLASGLRPQGSTSFDSPKLKEGVGIGGFFEILREKQQS